MAQDLFYNRTVTDQAEDFKWSGGAGTNQGVRLVHFLDRPGPRTPAAAPEFLAAVGSVLVHHLSSGRRSGFGCGRASRYPARIGKRAVVADRLLSGVGNVRAQGGQEVERGEDTGRGAFRIAAAPALPAVVDDLAGFRAIAQAFEGDRQMNHVARHTPAGLVIVGIDPFALEN